MCNVFYGVASSDPWMPATSDPGPRAGEPRVRPLLEPGQALSVTFPKVSNGTGRPAAIGSFIFQLVEC